MAESPRAAEERAGVELPEEVLANILLRLPGRSLLRFRAACKPWCRRVSDRDFLLAHHLRQPAQPLLLDQRSVNDEGMDAFLMALYYYSLEAVDLRAALPPRTVLRFKDAESITFDALAVHGSCDGLLLLSHLDDHFVCNPATRQWAPLPPLPARECHISAFYAHAASGEYRVLYLRGDDDGGGGDELKYYVLAVGSQQQARCIERRASSDSVAEALATGGLERARTMPPVLLHGSLHWPPQPFQKGNILVFGTAAEAFRWMRPPVIGQYSLSFLFGTNEGKLALSNWDYNGWMAKLWTMQDYENEAWAFTYQIQVPVDKRVGNGMPLNVTIASLDGDMLVELSDKVLHYDKEGALLQTLNSDGPSISFTLHFLKESLVQHPFLRKHQDGDPEEPPFFTGLQVVPVLPQ